MADETDDTSEHVDDRSGNHEDEPAPGGIDGSTSSGIDGNQDALSATSGGASDPRRRQLLIAGGIIAVLLALGGLFIASRDSADAPTTTSTTSAAETTTSSVVELPARTFEVATVKDSVERVSILSEPPTEWSTTPKAVVATDPLPTPPHSQQDAPQLPPIPSVTDAAGGRYKALTGWEINNPGPFEPPQPITFLVTERRGDWVQVHIPVRPNGTLGYVSTESVTITSGQKRIEVHLSDHKLVAYDGNDVIVESQVVIGVDSTPTPTGTFYLTDIVPQKNAAGFYGPYVLPTNGYSETLNEFDDGAPVIALHGTNRPELLGQNRSNGCIRVPNDVITKLAEKMPAGTPIIIWP